MIEKFLDAGSRMKFPVNLFARLKQFLSYLRVHYTELEQPFRNVCRCDNLDSAVAALMTDLKMSIFDKRKQLVVTDNQGVIVWAVGLRVSQLSAVPASVSAVPASVSAVPDSRLAVPVLRLSLL